MKLSRGMKVKWQSVYNESHWFSGVILRMFYKPEDKLHLEGLCLIDDGTGLAPRVVRQAKVVVTNDPTRIRGIRK